MLMATAKTNKKPRITLWTPPLQFSYPYFVNPDQGRQYSDNKYKSDGLITKAIFKEKGKALQDAVLSVGKEYFGETFKLKNSKFKTPFKDTDTDDKIENEAMKNCIMIRAKSDKAPLFIGPRKGSDGKFVHLTPQQIANLKGGDWGLLNITVFPYDQQGGGVTFGLNAVQFWKEGEGFGQGRSKLLETAEELEAEVETAENEDVADGSTDDDSVV
jgi:hypothetical protein